MKRFSLLFPGLLLALLLAVSCASTPEQAPAAPEAPEDTAESATDSMTDGMRIPLVPAPDEELRNAEELKQTIDEYDLSFALPDEYEKGNEELLAGKDAMGRDNAGAKVHLDSAALSFQKVIDTALDEGTRARKNEMQAAKSHADSVRASRAAAAEYTQAESLAQESLLLLDEEKYPEAYELSGAAITAYMRSHDVALGRRNAASTELQRTDSAQQTTDAHVDELIREYEGEAP